MAVFYKTETLELPIHQNNDVNVYKIKTVKV